MFLNRDGTPASGYVTFESQIPVSIGGVIVCPGRITAQLDGTGTVTVSLPPPMTWPEHHRLAYTVTEGISSGGRPPYPLEVPHDQPGSTCPQWMRPSTTPPADPAWRQGRPRRPWPHRPRRRAQRRHRDFQRVRRAASGHSAGNYYTSTLAENIASWNFTGLPPAGTGITFAFLFTQAASNYTIAWPASFDWGRGVIAPTMPTGAGSQLILVLTSFDGGVIWDAPPPASGSFDMIYRHMLRPILRPVLCQRPAAVQRNFRLRYSRRLARARSPPLRQ